MASVTYVFDHPSMREKAREGRPGDGFRVEYRGWGCLGTVVAIIHFAAPGIPPAVTWFDQCEVTRFEEPG